MNRRLGWNDGKTESFVFTAIDRLASGGVSVNGRRWHRPKDTLATELTVSGISGVHAAYLAMGGHDFLIGDGGLHYGPEYVEESYYCAQLLPGLFATIDVQHVANPAGESMMDLDGAPYGGARYPVESVMGGRSFVKFHLDVGIGDVVLDPPERAQLRDWLGFAGITPPDVPMIQREQQFAEKLHAYTLPGTTPNSRVRDLVDMVLLIRSGTPVSGRVVKALHATFGRRATHSVPEALTPPPQEWSAPFAKLAAECSLDLTAAEAFGVLIEFCTGSEAVRAIFRV